MRALDRGILVLFPAVLLIRLGATDDHLLYVKGSMGRWLVLSGSVLLVLAFSQLRIAIRQRGNRAEPTADTESHSHRENWISYLLVLPALAVFVVPLAPLGSYAVAGQSSRQLPEPVDTTYPPPPEPTNGAIDLTLSEFTYRVNYDDDRQLEGEPVRLTGFVADPTGEDFLLTRFALSCCAADGLPVQVRVQGVAPPEDSWVTVVGTWVPAAEDPEADVPMPEMLAESVTPIDQPREPYE
ncbi:MAG: TIGR03943 family protein [Actinomycetia bacterium]|nr:TIGR03943 family protein [Actinomycetes bacterium]